jgi:hypothetical protein
MYNMKMLFFYLFYVKDEVNRKRKCKVVVLWRFHRSIPLQDVYGIKKPQPRSKFGIPDLRNTKQDSPVDHDIHWNPVSTEGASLLPVSVDEVVAGG